MGLAERVMGLGGACRQEWRCTIGEAVPGRRGLLGWLLGPVTAVTRYPAVLQVHRPLLQGLQRGTREEEEGEGGTHVVIIE